MSFSTPSPAALCTVCVPLGFGRAGWNLVSLRGFGDIPVLGYAFQSHDNERVKRNLLVFVTPTILDQRYGTGLEDQVSGVHHVGEDYADPNGWRNNAKGAVRLVPTSNRQLAEDYAKPGSPPPPDEAPQVQFKSDVKDRDE